MLLDLLRGAAEQAAERPVVISPAGTLTYGGAVRRSVAVAGGLRARGIERFGADLGDPGDVLVALAGSSAAGAEACVYSHELDDAGRARLVDTFGHGVVVTDRGRAPETAEAVSLADLEAADGGLPPAPERSPVLILTTGTTGNQRAARHDWGRLVHTVRHPDDTPGARWLLVQNLNQFGGIQVLLHALASRATLVAPVSRQPGDAIAALRDHQVTHVSATPTFWRLLMTGLDAESARSLALEQITLGGEAVPSALIERLQRTFPGARISQIYGATEFGTAVSVRDGRPGLPASVLERGEDADVQIRIVDGELQIRTRIGMLGYHAEEAVGEGWRGTGDLVELRGDRIHFVGRKSEIINVGGAKVHPLPTEEVVSSVEGVELVAAYGRPNAVTGQILALDVVPSAGADTDRLEAAIRTACEALPRAARPRRIRFVSELATHGHKVARHGAARRP